MIPLSKPSIGESEFSAVKAVLESGWLTHGNKNTEFEAAIADFIGVKHAVSLNSCASALQLAIEALNIAGEVIVPSFTFVASVNSIINAGATPVLADIDERSCNIAPSSIRSLLTGRTEAIMPVHFAGQCADMTEIRAIADRHGLAIIEDSAETLGGTHCGQQAGSFGIGCFSFFPTKNITTGEGGMLTTNDKQQADRVRALSGHGIDSTTLEREGMKYPWERVATHSGYNMRMSNLLAAVGIEQLKKLQQMNDARRRCAELYNEALRVVECLELPVEEKNSYHVYQMYTPKLRIPGRDNLVMFLREQGVSASVHFCPPVHLHRRYKDAKDIVRGDVSISEKVSRSILTLPLYPGLSESDIRFVADKIKAWFDRN